MVSRAWFDVNEGPGRARDSRTDDSLIVRLGAARMKRTSPLSERTHCDVSLLSTGARRRLTVRR